MATKYDPQGAANLEAEKLVKECLKLLMPPEESELEVLRECMPWIADYFDQEERARKLSMRLSSLQVTECARGLGEHLSPNSSACQHMHTVQSFNWE